MSIIDKLTGLISDVTQLELDNKTLNEQLLNLENEIKEGYKSFDTETHILVEREFLKNVCGAADDVANSAQQASDEARSTYSCAEEARYLSDSASQSAQDIVDDIETLLSEDNK